MDNYHSISILLVVSTIFERAVQEQLVSHLESHNLVSNYQCGFFRRHSHSLQLRFCQIWLDKTWTLAGTIFVDFHKAF